MRSHTVSVAVVAWLVGLGPAATADVVYVNGAAPGGDGSSWAQAFSDLHDALAAAAPGDELWVAAGVYRPAGPGGDRNVSFELRSGVAVYGGFDGTESDRLQRNWLANVAILSGDLNGDDGAQFEGNDENSFHVVIADNLAEPFRLDGFVVSDGNGDGQPGGGLRSDETVFTVANCVFNRNSAQTGGGLYALGGDAITVVGCSFTDNFANIAGGFQLREAGSAEVHDCIVVGNQAVSGEGGGAVQDLEQLDMRRCLFSTNITRSIGGFASLGTDTTIVDCSFIDNDGGFVAGGLGTGLGGSTLLINCVFHGNSGMLEGGGIEAANPIELINCTISNNVGGGLMVTPEASGVVRNSIVWGNTESQIAGDVSVMFSDVEGGYPGSGNIAVDPLFVQPGVGNVRLADASPCLDAGDNTFVPGDIVTDLDGAPRIQNGIVDLGPYEGAHGVVESSAAMVADLDEGQTAILIIDETEFDPLAATTVIVANLGAGDDQSYQISVVPDLHRAAGGYERQGPVHRVETSMADGAFLATVCLPFDADDLSGADPLAMDLTTYDAGTGNWAIAVHANVATSPGLFSSIGDRITAVGDDAWGVNFEPGDYGVYWDPSAAHGFVWANLDTAGDFAFGVPNCPADAMQPPNEVVNMRDLRAVLSQWGAGAGPYDIDNDGGVGSLDLLVVLSAWGVCK